MQLTWQQAPSPRAYLLAGVPALRRCKRGSGEKARKGQWVRWVGCAKDAISAALKAAAEAPPCTHQVADV